MKNTSQIALLGTSILFAISCSTPLKTREVQSALSPTSIVTKKYKWTKKTISVCFIDTEKQLQDYKQQDFFISEKDEEGNVKNNALDLIVTPFGEKFKSEIKSAIQSSYHTKDVGLQFIGWTDCDSKFSDVAIAYSNSPDKTNLNVSMVGDPSKKYPTPKINLVRLNSGFFKSDDSTMQEIADRYKIQNQPHLLKLIEDYKDFARLSAIVHEFGHLAGLHHEHYRQDHEQVLKDIDLTYNSSYAESVLFPIKMKPLDTSDFLIVSEFDPFSAMNYMRNSNYAAVEIAINCLNKKYPNYSAADLKHVCDFNYLNRLIRRNAGENYLSMGDIKSLQILYKNAPEGNSKLIADQELYQWVKSTKALVEKYQLKFPLTIAGQTVVTVPKEALYCGFVQDTQDKTLRILTTPNGELTRAWYHQSVYENVISHDYGFEFTSIKKNGHCGNCYDLETTYNGQPFKASIRVTKKADTVSIKMDDLNAFVGCGETDMTHAIHLYKEYMEKKKNKVY